MTFLCRAQFIPYLYDVRVPNHIPDKYISGWVRTTREMLNKFVEPFPWLHVFGYEEWVQCCVHFDAAYNVILRHDPSLYNVFVNKQKENANTADKMSKVIDQPIDLQVIQTETLGVLPQVNLRVRLFQD